MQLGLCRKCKVRWGWMGDPPLALAYCPRCKGPLARTLYYAKDEARLEVPLAGNPHPTTRAGLREVRLAGC